MKRIGKNHTSVPVTETSESMAALVSGMADNFNNILTTVMGACTLIDRDYAANKELLLYVSLIRVSAERAAALSIKLMIASSLVQDRCCKEINMKVSKYRTTSVRDK